MKLAPNRYMYAHIVSMKSGLEGRNNLTYTTKQFDKVFASQ